MYQGSYLPYESQLGNMNKGSFIAARNRDINTVEPEPMPSEGDSEASMPSNVKSLGSN